MANHSASFVAEMVSFSSTKKVPPESMQRSIKLTKKAKRIYKIKLKYDVRQISAHDRVDGRKNASVLAFSAASYAMWTTDREIMIKQRRPKDDPVQKVRKLIFT